jgi:DNA-binding CsgD family transcriptional regulator
VQIETIEKEEEIALLQEKNERDKATRKFLYTLIFGLITTSSFVLGFFRIRNRANRNKLEMEKQLLITELREKEKALSNHTLQMIHHRNGFMEIEIELKRILANDETRRFHKIVNIINVNQSLDREWDNFNQYFTNVHERFYDNLKQLSSTLSLHEQRLCALIRMNLASREIATLLNIEVSSVKMAKYRLKKKLQLDEQEDLNEFIGKV